MKESIMNELLEVWLQPKKFIRENRMITVRPQRGSFRESMDECETIWLSHDALVKWLKKYHQLNDTDEITVKHMGIDSRNGWNTSIICINGDGVAFANMPI